MKLFKNLRNGALALSAMPANIAPVAYAVGDTTSNKIVVQILNVVENIAFYIGLILLAWSIVMLVLAFKNEDADSKSRAIMLIVVSVVLIGIKLLLKPIMTAAGFNWA